MFLSISALSISTRIDRRREFVADCPPWPAEVLRCSAGSSEASTIFECLLIRVSICRPTRTPRRPLSKALWRNHQFRKLLRYSAVSLVFVPLGQVFVRCSVAFSQCREMWAVIATSVILTPPNYYANKRFVWRHKAEDNMHTEILVFWVAAILGTASAAALVTVAAHVGSAG